MERERKREGEKERKRERGRERGGGGDGKKGKKEPFFSGSPKRFTNKVTDVESPTSS